MGDVVKLPNLPDLPVTKGDRYRAMGCEVEVLRVARTWADIRVSNGPETWTKRQQLPFPVDWEKQDPRRGTVSLVPDDDELTWTIHPGVTWREVVRDSPLNQAQIAEQMGISPKHLSQILHCHVMPGLDATTAFATVMGVSARVLWRLTCDHKLDLALGKTDLTSNYL
jgi:hypothetical protein